MLGKSLLLFFQNVITVTVYMPLLTITNAFPCEQAKLEGVHSTFVGQRPLSCIPVACYVHVGCTFLIALKGSEDALFCHVKDVLLHFEI